MPGRETNNCRACRNNRSLNKSIIKERIYLDPADLNLGGMSIPLSVCSAPAVLRKAILGKAVLRKAILGKAILGKVVLEKAAFGKAVSRNGRPHVCPCPSVWHASVGHQFKISKSKNSL